METPVLVSAPTPDSQCTPRLAQALLLAPGSRKACAQHMQGSAHQGCEGEQTSDRHKDEHPAAPGCGCLSR